MSEWEKMLEEGMEYQPTILTNPRHKRSRVMLVNGIRIQFWCSRSWFPCNRFFVRRVNNGVYTIIIPVMNCTSNEEEKKSNIPRRQLVAVRRYMATIKRLPPKVTADVRNPACLSNV